MGMRLDPFMDKQSGENFDRVQYQLLKRMIRKGDVLYIHSLDRFGRNKEEILQEWNDITKKTQADIVVMDMPLLDTTQFKGSLGTFIADLVLQILSWMAEEERERIRKRQREGIDVALQNGVPFGRPKAQVTEEFKEIYNLWKAGGMKIIHCLHSLITYEIKSICRFSNGFFHVFFNWKIQLYSCETIYTYFVYKLTGSLYAKGTGC
ncbi:recombinase family protein [Peribacillus butanolivorans]|uniref:recombinase family protein n=1 Tax=Peribacillus butanolivorans TaxID=421767 RepID=UPI0036A825F6